MFNRACVSNYTGEVYHNLPLSELANGFPYAGKGYICAATGEVVFTLRELVKSIIAEYRFTGCVYRWYSFRTLRNYYKKEC